MEPRASVNMDATTDIGSVGAKFKFELGCPFPSGANRQITPVVLAGSGPEYAVHDLLITVLSDLTGSPKSL